MTNAEYKKVGSTSTLEKRKCSSKNSNSSKTNCTHLNYLRRTDYLLIPLEQVDGFKKQRYPSLFLSTGRCY